MQDNYYNYMMTKFLAELKKMVSIFETSTMKEYKTMKVKDWKKIEGFAKSLNEYSNDNKCNKLMEYYSTRIYPVIMSAELKKFGFKNLMVIKIDDYDFRRLIYECERLIY